MHIQNAEYVTFDSLAASKLTRLERDQISAAAEYYKPAPLPVLQKQTPAVIGTVSGVIDANVRAVAYAHTENRRLVYLQTVGNTTGVSAIHATIADKNGVRVTYPMKPGQRFAQSAVLNAWDGDAVYKVRASTSTLAASMRLVVGQAMVVSDPQQGSSEEGDNGEISPIWYVSHQMFIDALMYYTRVKTGYALKSQWAEYLYWGGIKAKLITQLTCVNCDFVGVNTQHELWQALVLAGLKYAAIR